jgi:hypothetical protein
MRRDDSRTDKQVEFWFHTELLSLIKRGLSSDESTIYIVDLRLLRVADASRYSYKTGSEIECACSMHFTTPMRTSIRPGPAGDQRVKRTKFLQFNLCSPSSERHFLFASDWLSVACVAA